jgi:hypothetical protein
MVTFGGVQIAAKRCVQTSSGGGSNMKFRQHWRQMQAEAERCVAVLIGAVPLAALHWLALRYSEG